jgi:hypothetical protein
MTIHGESLKIFLPFSESNSFVGSSSPYNCLQTEKIFATYICCFANSMNKTQVMTGSFSEEKLMAKLTVKIGYTVEKLFNGVWRFPGCFLEKNSEIF